MDCEKCPAWDVERCGCTIPDLDRWYACPDEAAKPENQKELLEWIEWMERRRKVRNDAF